MFSNLRFCKMNFLSHFVLIIFYWKYLSLAFKRCSKQGALSLRSALLRQSSSISGRKLNFRSQFTIFFDWYFIAQFKTEISKFLGSFPRTSTMTISRSSRPFQITIFSQSFRFSTAILTSPVNFAPGYVSWNNISGSDWFSRRLSRNEFLSAWLTKTAFGLDFKIDEIFIRSSSDSLLEHKTSGTFLIWL